jgi:hypothetical protein
MVLIDVVDTPVEEFGAHLFMVLVDVVETPEEECGAHLVKCLVYIVDTLMWCPPGHGS